MKKLVLFFCCLSLAIVGFAGQSQAVPVGLELLLLVDVSGSVDTTEYDLQKNGYVSAFNDPLIHAAIAGITDGIAVAYAEWSSSGQQFLNVGWTQLTDAASSSAFAAAIAGSSRAFSGLTAPGSALQWGRGQFSNNFEGAREVIDISGDGQQNDGVNTFDQATAAFAQGITVNGLPILTDDPGLDVWYQNNITGPGGGFLVVANNFTDFADAVTQKIGREITPTPEPGVMLLLGLGLVGLAAMRRRTR